MLSRHMCDAISVTGSLGGRAERPNGAWGPAFSRWKAVPRTEPVGGTGAVQFEVEPAIGCADDPRNPR